MRWASDCQLFTRVSRMVAPLICCALLISICLSGCAFFGSGGQRGASTAHPAAGGGATTSPATRAALPGGWSYLLQRTPYAASAVGDVATTPAQAGRVAVCAIPGPQRKAAPPVFLLSDDGGRTWDAHVIPGSAASMDCEVAADTQQPDTFVVGSNGGGQPGVNPQQPVYATTDAGRSWVSVAPPAEHIIGLNPGDHVTLVNGQLVATLGALGPTAVPEIGAWRIGSATEWEIVDANVPYVNQDGHRTLPLAFVSDPADAQRMYVAMYRPAGGIVLFATSNHGASWTQRYAWPTSNLLQIWASGQGRVYAQDLIEPTAQAQQFFYSADAGANWVGTGLHERGVDDVFVGPTGRVVTIADGSIFALDPASGYFTLLGAAPMQDALLQGSRCAIAEGRAPQLLCTTQSDAYAYALPAAPAQ